MRIDVDMNSILSRISPRTLWAWLKAGDDQSALIAADLKDALRDIGDDDPELEDALIRVINHYSPSHKQIRARRRRAK